MADSNQNLVQFRLTGTLSISGTTVNVSNDILRNTAIDVENASITLQNEGGTTFELIQATITAGILTTSKRGIKRDKTLTEDATLKREWRPGTIGFITSFASDIADITGDNTFTGDNEFTGDNTFNGNVFLGKGFRVPEFDNVTTRDTAIPTPEDGMICYLQDVEDYYSYKNGIWVKGLGGSGGSVTWYQDSTDDGSITGTINGVNTTFNLSNTPAQPQAVILTYNGQTLDYGSDYTITGKVITMILVPVSGKLTAIYPDTPVGTGSADTRVTTTTDAHNGEFFRNSGDSDSLYYKDNEGDNIKLIDVTSNKIVGSNIDYTGVDLTSNISTATDTAPGVVEKATDAEVITGTDTTRYVTPKQAKDNYEQKHLFGTGSMISQNSATTIVFNHSFGSIPKIIRFYSQLASSTSLINGIYLGGSQSCIGGANGSIINGSVMSIGGLIRANVTNITTTTFTLESPQNSSSSYTFNFIYEME